MSIKNGKRRMTKNLKKLIVIVLCVIMCSGCQSMQKFEIYETDLTENIENYGELFEEYNVDAKIAMYEDTEYLQLTFSDGFSALYRYGLNYIQKDLQREDEDGYRYSGKVEIKIKSDETALVYVSYDGIGGKGITNGEFVLPDFSEMLPSRALKQDDSSALKIIESWISTQEMTELYEEAKEMEQRMLEDKGLDKAM